MSAHLGVPCQPDAREDLPTDRIIPVAKRRTDRRRGDRPRSAPQDFVVAAEKWLAVGAVDHRGKSRPRREVRRCPLPDITDHLLRAVCRRARREGTHRGGPEAQATQVGEAFGGFLRSPRPGASSLKHRVPGARLLPFDLRWQARLRPGSEGLRLVVADVLHWLIERYVLVNPEPAPGA